MFKLFRTFLLMLFIVSATTTVYSETSWITKKSDKTKVELKKEKKEKKEKKKEWIAKKKKNKKQFKDKAKNIYGVVITPNSLTNDVCIESTKTEEHRLSLSKQIIPRGYGTGEIHPLGEKLTIGS